MTGRPGSWEAEEEAAAAAAVKPGGRAIMSVGFPDRVHTVYDLYDSISHTPTSVSGLVRVYRPAPLFLACEDSCDAGHPQPLLCHGIKYIETLPHRPCLGWRRE